MSLEKEVEKFLLETAVSGGVLERGKLEEMKLSEKLEWAKQIIESCEGIE